MLRAQCFIEQHKYMQELSTEISNGLCRLLFILALGVGVQSFRLALPPTVWRTTVGDTAKETATRRSPLYLAFSRYWHSEARAILTSLSGLNSSKV